jgi:hypothetical protein
MNPTSRWHAALNRALLTDTTRQAMLAGIQKVAPQSVLYQVPAIAASYAALVTKGATFTTTVAVAAADEKQYRASASAANLARSAFDGELVTLKTAVENNATDATDIPGMGFVSQVLVKSSKTPPDAPAGVLYFPAKEHGKGRVVVQGTGYLGHFVAEVSNDPLGTWTALPGNGKERRLSGYPSGTRLWVHFAAVRWGLQSPWSTPILVIIP